MIRMLLAMMCSLAIGFVFVGTPSIAYFVARDQMRRSHFASVAAALIVGGAVHLGFIAISALMLAAATQEMLLVFAILWSIQTPLVAYDVWTAGKL
jgi:hypothetical protein